MVFKNLLVVIVLYTDTCSLSIGKVRSSYLLNPLYTGGNSNTSLNRVPLPVKDLVNLTLALVVVDFANTKGCKKREK